MAFLVELSCTNLKNRDNHIATKEITKGYYIELFDVYNGGVFGGGLTAYWLTDSTKLREFIFTSEDKEYVDWEVQYNFVKIKLISRRKVDKGKILDEVMYKIE